jgi:hypothetical protein
MRRALISNLAALILIGVLAGTGAAKPAPAPRTIEGTYKTPALGVSPQEGTRAYYYDCLNGIGCALLKLGAKDRFATLEVADAAGQPVQAVVYRVPGFDEIGRFCGSTGEAWSTNGATELLVHVVPGTCESGGASVATTGTVRATVTSKL